ncbi:MAG: RNA polymerase sigma factor [Lachnospiraceae bacterium]|nr:RNA polymerase sigma factor [Lachnospiraceae bacterium]
MKEFVKRYEKIYPKMYRTAYYYMRNRQEAEDAVADTALIAYEKREQLREEEKFELWIMKILVNRCKKKMRTWFQKECTIEELPASVERELAKDPDLVASVAVKQAFWELKDEERFIVALSVFGGYTGEEIADILNKNHSTVRSKYRRALQKMRQKLEV